MHNISNNTLTPICPVPDYKNDDDSCLWNLKFYVFLRYPTFKEGNLTHWSKDLQKACDLVRGHPAPSTLSEACKGNITQVVKELCQDKGKDSFSSAKDISRFCSYRGSNQFLDPLLRTLYLIGGTILGAATLTGGALLTYRLIQGKNSYQSIK